MPDYDVTINFPRDLSEEEFQEFLRELGVRIQGRIQENFSDRAEGRWGARGVPNIAGIITDLERGPSIRDRRFSPDTTGVDTGRLRNSFSPVGSVDLVNRTVQIGTDVEYAESFHLGLPSSFELTDNVQRNMRLWQRRNRDKMDKWGLWWIMSRHDRRVIVNPMPRPLIFEGQIRRLAQEVMDDLYG